MVVVCVSIRGFLLQMCYWVCVTMLLVFWLMIFLFSYGCYVMVLNGWVLGCCFVEVDVGWRLLLKVFDLSRPDHLEITVMWVVVGVSNIR